MKKWCVKFRENGDEYSGYLTVKANSVKRISSTAFAADGVEIEIDEAITSIDEA